MTQDSRIEVVIEEDLGGFLPAGHAMLLGMAASGAPLDAILRAVAELIEADIPGALASIMLLGPRGRLYPAAAPHVPAAHLRQMADGVPVGPRGGTCGLAVQRLQPVITEDIEVMPDWAPLAPIAHAAGLRACWSVPIVGAAHRALGTFALYYRRRMRPTPIQVQRLGGYAQLVAIAVQHDAARRRAEGVRDADALTGLPAGTMLASAVEELLEGGAAGEWVAVTTIEVGRLGACNRALGYPAGDELVRSAAARLSGLLGDDERLIRAGGSTFSLVHRGAGDEAPDALPLRMLAALDAPFAIAGTSFVAAPRAGIAVHMVGDRTAGTVDDLIGASLDVLERARRDGSATLARAALPQHRDAHRDLVIENDLRRAVEAGELVAHYQPQVRLDTGEVVGVEALVRWEHPVDGLRGPATILPAVDRARLHPELSRHMLRTACRDAARWRSARPEAPLMVAVNLSAVELHDPRLPAAVEEALAASGLPPGLLCLEITERAALTELRRTEQILRALKRLGVQIAMDDFGTGYSALAHARRFPIDHLKVDGSFVAGIDRDPHDVAVVSAIIGLADGLGLDVIAEGVEHEVHRSVLRELGCRVAQGHLWSAAVPADRVDALLGAGLDLGHPLAAIPPGDGADGSWELDPDNVVATVVHEARSPLSVLRLYAELLGAPEADVDRGEIADVLVQQVDVLDGIFSAASDARALDRGALPLHRAPVAMDDLIRGVVREVERTAGITVDLEIRTEVVLADAPRIRQVLVNLLDNAVRFAPAGSTIGVRMEAGTDTVELLVEDDGPGVPPERVGAIFRKYGQASPGPGLGLGLYISRQLARSHGGDLAYERRATGGARFRLTLPVDPAPPTRSA
jgi:EAL domain-containing protein (putative c-di-GMP-specific phosphodiesterase class I)/GGDEF domain-containing protein/anti-sigma regulatory factor (Ser/Thr protein kinase)